MRFLFVNKITEMSANRIRGQVVFDTREPWQRSFVGIGPQVSTSVISEAVGQLVSWLSLKHNDFSGRPVFLFASRIELGDSVAPGQAVELEAEISDQSAESFIFSGRATVAGRTVVEVKDCGGYLMPLAELEDPALSRQRFEQLIGPGLPPNPGGEPFSYTSLVDLCRSHGVGETIVTEKKFSASERFYPDHFPHFPVTPIVVINEMIGEATARMMNEAGQRRFYVKPCSVQDLKIKSFIRPGDTAVVSIRKTESFGDQFETIAEVALNERRILRGRYRYQLKPIE